MYVYFYCAKNYKLGNTLSGIARLHDPVYSAEELAAVKEMLSEKYGWPRDTFAIEAFTFLHEVKEAKPARVK